MSQKDNKKEINSTAISVADTGDQILITDNSIDLVKVRQVLGVYLKKGKELITDPNAENALAALLIIKKDATKLIKDAEARLLEVGLAEKGDDFTGASGKQVSVTYQSKSDFECDEIDDIDKEFVRKSLNKTAIKKYVEENGLPPNGIDFVQQPKKLQLKLL